MKVIKKPIGKLRKTMSTKKVHFKIKYSEVKKILKWKSYLNLKKQLIILLHGIKIILIVGNSEVTLLQIKEMISKIK